MLTPTYLKELLEAVGHATDGLKFAGGSFAVHSGSSLRQLIETAHEHNVYVSTGGFIEHILTQARSERKIDVGRGHARPTSAVAIMQCACSLMLAMPMQVLPRTVLHALTTGPRGGAGLSQGVQAAGV